MRKCLSDRRLDRGSLDTGGVRRNLGRTGRADRCDDAGGGEEQRTDRRNGETLKIGFVEGRHGIFPETW
jgi:hypothetical protein